jgi:PAT family beta-lactamase induction signal transducer AmpG
MPLAFAVIALIVAFISASQDIVVDAYRTDILPDVERGFGAATFVFGYRIAMLVAGSLALIMSDRIGWQHTYFLMAFFMIIGVCGAFMGREPDHKVVPPKTMEEAIWGPLKDFVSRKSALLFVLLIIFYKLGDAYAGSLTTPFLIRGVYFTPTDVGTINKGLGLIATIAGALFGGTIMVKLGLFRSLMVLGIFQMISNLSFMALAWIGKSYPAMITAVAFENVSGGMGTAAFTALLMALCDKRFSATQFALLSSLSALGRVFISPTSGFLQVAVGWPVFFFITTLVALPGLALLWRLRNDINSINEV